MAYRWINIDELDSAKDAQSARAILSGSLKTDKST